VAYKNERSEKQMVNKKMKVDKISAFFRALLCTLILSSCITLLISGITIADKSTRAIVSSGESPAIDLKVDKNIATIDFLGGKYNVDFSFLESIKKDASPIAVFVPVEYRFSAIGMRKLPEIISDFINKYI